MNLEMKAIKYFASGSEETYCYTAVVYLDGKPFADVGNDGHGGSDRVNHHDKSPLIKVKGAWREKFQEIEEYFASLPKTDVGKYDWCPEGFDQKFEYWCADQVGKYLTIRDLKRHLKRAYLFTTKDGLRESRYHPLNDTPKVVRMKTQQIKRRYPEAVILNELPLEEALEIYIGATGG
mgnify:CR=1 FL=1|tara:strand:+ start:2152 stop:2685 length:534 start_codon:yes stop_codon:yes gene_type:complete